MAATLLKLIDKVKNTDESCLLFALQVLQKVTPKSEVLIDAILKNTTSVTFYTHSHAILLLTMSKNFKIRGKHIEEFWKKRRYCQKKLTGLYYAGATYEGCVRELIHQELAQQCVVFFDVDEWMPDILRDEEFMQKMLRYPEEVCICSRLVYLRYFVTSMRGCDYDHEYIPYTRRILDWLMEIIESPVYRECCQSQSDALVYIYSRLTHHDVIDDKWVRQMDKFVANPSLVKYVLKKYRETFGFKKSIPILFDIIKSIENGGLLVSDIVNSFFCILKGGPPDSLSYQDIQKVLYLLLEHCSSSMYMTVIHNLIGEKVIQQKEWTDNLIDAQKYRCSSYSYLIYVCCEYFTEEQRTLMATFLFSSLKGRCKGMIDVDLLCYLYNPLMDYAMEELHKKDHMEIIASCGDIDSILQSTDDPYELMRIFHRLKDERCVKVSLSCIYQVWTKCVQNLWVCPAHQCTAYMNVLEGLILEYGTGFIKPCLNLGVFKMLPSMLAKHLDYKNFGRYSNVWMRVIVLLPIKTKLKRECVMTVLNLLTQYDEDKKEKDSTLVLYPFVKDINQIIASYLQWDDIRWIECHLFSKHTPELSSLLFQLLYFSKIGERRLKRILRDVTDANVLREYKLYKVMDLLNINSIRMSTLEKTEKIWKELKDTTDDAESAWSHFTQCCDITLAEPIVLLAVKSMPCVQTWNAFINRLIIRCSDRTICECVSILLGHLKRSKNMQENVLGLLRMCIDLVSVQSFEKVPVYSLEMFLGLWDTEVHTRSAILAKLIKIEIEMEKKSLELIKTKLPYELCGVIQSFLLFETSSTIL